MSAQNDRLQTITIWVARIVVALVFIINVQCALQFIILPQNYVAAYELSGEAGIAAIRGLGVAFLMWNATYPLVIWQPAKHRVLFGVVLAQQLIGLIGEIFIWSTVHTSHTLLASSILRFVAFDAGGLVLMLVAFVLLMRVFRKSE